ncbi:MAG: aspartate-semialdehyde dehydrogenase [Candidatus Sumerlaeota bacterium]|nr:aspartate-semialdehyde dehydrogenase [Candidatus Sumerlaeota bacterium]
MSYTVAVLGASGAVGQEMVATLERRGFPAGELRLLASPRSAGRTLRFQGRLHTVTAVTPESFEGVDVALFSAGGGVSQEWAPIAAEKGAIVVDNTSAFRMADDVPLVIPEVNAHVLEQKLARGIIANPNCSTIQMIHALKPLHDAFTIKRIVVATYQSVSGKGTRAIDEMLDQSAAVLAGEDDFECEQFPHQIAFNVLPHIDSFTENGYTKEELKMVNETRKILEAPGIMVSATCVRVPVTRGHSEAVNVEFEKKVTPEKARELLAAFPGIVVVDDVANNHYPLPLYAENREPTFVGRIRQDISNPQGTSLDMWIVSDNLWKGAALNAVQIAEWLASKGKLGKSAAK